MVCVIGNVVDGGDDGDGCGPGGMDIHVVPLSRWWLIPVEPGMIIVVMVVLVVAGVMSIGISVLVVVIDVSDD